LIEVLYKEAMMDTERRLDKLELFAEDARIRLARIETLLDGTATKADLAALETSPVQWFIATAFAITTVTAGVAVASIRLIH
jgi:hypothetical protein